jgi:allantoin racemase
VLFRSSGKATKQEVVDRFVNEVNLAKKDGAASIIMGCMTMAFLLLDESANQVAAIPVINPAKIAIKIAEMMISLGMRHSDAAYPKPDYERIKLSLFQD